MSLKLTDIRSLDEMITLVVGENDKKATITIHKKVLCAYSPFFEAACKPEWMKPEEKVINLPEDNPEAIKAMVYWMYYNRICIPKSQVQMAFELESESPEGLFTAWGLLVRLYILGDKYQMPRLKNDSIDALIRIWKGVSWTKIDVVTFAFNNTATSSSLRSVLISMLRWDYLDHGDCDEFENFDFNSDGIEEVLLALVIEMDRYPYRNGSSTKRSERQQDPRDNFCKKYHEGCAEQSRCKHPKRFVVDEEE